MHPKASLHSAWQSFSEYIRERDGWQCVQCASSKEAGAVMQAGHVVPVGNSGLAIKFLEDDVFCQCAYHNRAHTKNQKDYYHWFDSHHSPTVRAEIQALKKQLVGRLAVSIKDGVYFRAGDYGAVRDYYRGKLAGLTRNQSVR